MLPIKLLKIQVHINIMKRLINELDKIIFNQSQLKRFLDSMDLHFTHIAQLLLLTIVVVGILTNLQRLL